MVIKTISICLLGLALVAGIVRAEDVPATEPAVELQSEQQAATQAVDSAAIGPTATPEGEEAAEEEAPAAPRTTTEILLDEIARLGSELRLLRHQLAAAELEATQAKRELEEMQQFISDHHEYGRDFQSYTSIRDIAEREAQQRELEKKRQEHAQLQAERRTRRDMLRAERDQQRAVNDRFASYRDAGFTPLGLDVFAGKMAYHYSTTSNTNSRVKWRAGIGRFLRVNNTVEEIDFTGMTISGSILNAADTIRNIGVAITFFDNNGNQVGHEIVQVKNARPDVPYPFTSSISMALNRAFSTSSIYVLYADEVDGVTE